MALSGYTKLSSSILASTIWRESNETRLVWITMLALADADGVVEASVPGLSDLARVPLPACEEALRALQAPDPYSRTVAHDGRRIEPVDGGWLLLNYQRFREVADKDARREYLRVKQQESRARKRSHESVNTVNIGQQKSTQAEAEAEAEACVLRKEHVEHCGADAPADGLVDVEPKKKRKTTHRGHVSGYCDWMCLPTRLRDQFVATAGEDISTPEARAAVEARVLAWAGRVREKWEGRAIGDGSWDFWKFRWRERIGSTTAVAVTAPTRHTMMPDAPSIELTPERIERLRLIREQVASEYRGEPA